MKLSCNETLKTEARNRSQKRLFESIEAQLFHLDNWLILSKDALIFIDPKNSPDNFINNGFQKYPLSGQHQIQSLSTGNLYQRLCYGILEFTKIHRRNVETLKF